MNNCEAITTNLISWENFKEIEIKHYVNSLKTCKDSILKNWSHLLHPKRGFFELKGVVYIRSGGKLERFMVVASNTKNLDIFERNVFVYLVVVLM